MPVVVPRATASSLMVIWAVRQFRLASLRLTGDEYQELSRVSWLVVWAPETYNKRPFGSYLPLSRIHVKARVADGRPKVLTASTAT